MKRPSTVPPMIDKSEISAVRRSPVSKKGRFLRMTSGIAQPLPNVLPCAGDEEETVAHGRDQQQVEQRDHNVDLEGPERLTLDGARLIGQLGHGDHGSKRGILDELRRDARKRRRDDAE